MSQRYSGKSRKDSSTMKKAKLSIKEKRKIGRIRDIKIEEKTGKIYLLSDEGSFWKLKK